MKKSELLKLDNSKLNLKIKIQGTDFDRRRKLTNKQLTQMKKYYENGVNIKTLAQRYNVSESTVRYHVIPGQKIIQNTVRSLYRFVPPKIDSSARGEYKRSLLQANKLKI